MIGSTGSMLCPTQASTSTGSRSSSSGPRGGFLDLFFGRRARAAVFALGIMPYITASIIMQLLTIVIPKLEELAKEGEQGQKQITKYTRWLTVALSLVQSAGYIVLFRQYNALPDLNWWRAALIVTELGPAPSSSWPGELITARGIGNGMSIIIFISIVSGILVVARAVSSRSTRWRSSSCHVIALAVVVAAIWITTGERRVSVQYAAGWSGGA
jgi:preprotein translocase subunit SecY